MAKLLQSERFFRLYRFLPQRWLNRGAGALARLSRPRWLVRATIDAWIARRGIAMQDFEARDWPSVEAWFLRRLLPGARPVGAGIVAPADGILVGAGEVSGRTILQVKGRPLTLAALVNGSAARSSPRRAGGPRYDLDLSGYEGGRYATIFLTPNGYHYVHAPFAARLVGAKWLPGRYFPQNPAALQHIDAIYARNERLVLRLRLQEDDPRQEALLVLVGASLIGGIELRGVSRQAWAREGAPLPLDRFVNKGEELGHFTFGSTVVLVLPRGYAGPSLPAVGSDVRLGETLMHRTVGR